MTFYMAGHIIGAAGVYIQGKEGSVFYSGDFSSTPQQTIGGISIPKLRPDVMIMESTYGDKLHSNRKAEEDRLVQIVKEVIERGGKILIPAFAVGRAQEVILVLKKAMSKSKIPTIPIYVDGMVKNICRIYKRNPNYLKKPLAKKVWKDKEIFYTEKIQPVNSKEMRREILQRKGPCCIISSSGMMTGGPSLYYGEELIKDKKNHIAITGYQDEEAPGRHLLNFIDATEQEEKFLQIGERKLPVHCSIGKYGLSAHGDKGEILGSIQKLSPRKLFLVHGNPEIIQTLAKQVQSSIRGRVYIPTNGEDYSIHFENPRKQLNLLSIPPLDKGVWPQEGDLEELWKTLSISDRTVGYTLEELLYIWSGRVDYDECQVYHLQEILNDSIYFQPEDRKLFLYHPVLEKEISSAKGQGIMEVNEMLSLIEEFFPPETGLYKKGARFEEKIALLSFNFPSVVPEKYGERIGEFEEKTGWTVEINSQCNLSAIDPLIRNLLGEEQRVLIKTSYYALQNEVKATFSKKPVDTHPLTQRFQECTGLKLMVDYPQRTSPSKEIASTGFAPDPNREIMEQNAAFSLIEQAFSGAKDRLYKKSLKSDAQGKYIELSFISPFIGEKYSSWVEDLSKETNWRIKINPMANQMEIIQVALGLLHQDNIYPKKNPSILIAERKARVKLTQTPPTEQWKSIENDFQKQTGFLLEYAL